MIASAGQMVATTIEEPAAAWLAVDRLAREAAETKADLLVLPEATYPAYWLDSAERYMRDDIERTGAVVEKFSKLAAKHAFWLVAGFVEERDGKLFNAAGVWDRDGNLVGTAYKNFLWDCDHRWFQPGPDIRCFDTEFGRMGVLICADARVPEIAATLANDGAQFIVQPTAWVNTSNIRRTYRNVQPDFLIAARAMEFGVPFVCASKSGREGDHLEYVGQSRIVDEAGLVLVSAALGGEELVTATIAPTDPKPIDIKPEHLARLRSNDPPFTPGAASTARDAASAKGKASSSTRGASSASKTTGAAKFGPTIKVKLKADADAIAAALTAAGARVATLSTADLNTFAAARCLALDGVQVIVAAGRIADDTLARARAAENRIFVIIAKDEGDRVIDPGGNVAWRRADWSDEIELDLAQADLKEFTPETNIWRGRRVDCYRLGT